MTEPGAESEAAPQQPPLPSIITAPTTTSSAAIEKQQDTAKKAEPAAPASKETREPETANEEESKSATASEPVNDASPEDGQACPLITSANANGQKNDNGIDETNPVNFQGSVDSNNELPTVATLKRIDNYTVLDRFGKSHTFKSLYTGPNVARRVLVIFVRHFFCGNCQEYLKILSAAITPDALLRLPISTFITVVGCGNSGLIDMYAEATGCPFPIYADPTRNLYDDLGMVKSLALGEKPAYMANRSIVASSFASVLQGLKQIKSGLALKAGDQRQIGGEFLFEPFNAVTPTDELDRRMVARGEASVRKATMESGPGGTDGTITSKAEEEKDIENKLSAHNDGDEAEQTDKSIDGRDCDDVVEEKRVSWCHRMRSTRDHVEIPELAEVLGVDLDADALAAQPTAEQASRTSTSSNPSATTKTKQRWSRVLSERKGTGADRTLAPHIDEMKRNVASKTASD